MTKTFANAINEISTLPQIDQEKIGRGLLSYVEKLRGLRIEIDKGITSLNLGKGKSLGVESFVRTVRKEYGRS